jgi:glutathione S-transferase
MFLREKGIDVPSEELNVREGKQFEEPYTSMNPFHCVPFLELDDGTVVAESVTICRYLEELHPEPSLFGRQATERATIDMWNRRIEIDGLLPILHASRNHFSLFADRVVPGTRGDLPQLPAMVQRGKEMLGVFLDRLEPHLAGREFVTADRMTICDISGFFTMRPAERLGVDLKGTFPNVARWYQAIARRPSAQF